MSCDKCKNKPMVTQYLGDVQIDALDSLPEFILAERDVEDPLSGDLIRSLVRVPAGKLFPNGNYDGQTTIEPNNDFEVYEGQPLAGKIVNNVSSTTVELANIGDTPDFLIIGKLSGLLIIQAAGFIYYPNGHQFVIGQDYYLSDNGIPTTDSASGMKLFKPISRTKLVITLGR